MKNTIKSDDTYTDIIDMPHHVSVSHKRMSNLNRAAQFAPFAALTGHDAAILETARLTDKKLELDEDTKIKINQKLSYLEDNLEDCVDINITYFLPDDKKSGGSYVTQSGSVRKIDHYESLVILTNGLSIPIDNIFKIDGEIFVSDEWL